eukprot:4290955-Lingulodinium_polyedra.AAC.1
MSSSPFGPSAADTGGRYLGAWLAAAAYGALAEGVKWTKLALDAVAYGTWKRPAGELSDRSGLLVLSPSSLAVRASQ